MKIGNEEILAVYWGQDKVNAIIQGEDEVIYSGATPTPEPDPGPQPEVPTIVYDIETQGLGWNVGNHIELPFTLTTGTTIEIEGETYEDSDRVVGFSWEDEGGDESEGPISDGDDFRLMFNDNGFLYDYNDQRLQYYPANPTFSTPGHKFGLRIGNYYVYDSINGVYLVSGVTQSSVLNPTIKLKVDVGSFYLQGLKIYEGNTLVFNGLPCIDEENTSMVGLKDMVSGNFYWNSGLSMTYNMSCIAMQEISGTMEAECLCQKSGGQWDGEQCIESSEPEPSEPDVPEECAGYSSVDECYCVQGGGMWEYDEESGEWACNYSQPDPCEGMSADECTCMNEGGTWDPESEQCIHPEMPDPEGE